MPPAGRSFTCTNAPPTPLPQLVDYMQLPVESYALYDAELMRRLDADTFELRLPLRGSAGGLDLMQPTLRVRVTPDYDASSLRIASLGASLFGLEEASNRTAAEAGDAVSWGVLGEAGGAPPPSPPPPLPAPPPAVNMAKDDAPLSGAEGQRIVGGIERGLRSASLAFNTTLAWKGGLTRSRSGDKGNFTRLSTTVQARLRSARCAHGLCSPVRCGPV